MDAETRAAQLENALRAIVDNVYRRPDCWLRVDDDVIDEARALLAGESAPAGDANA